MAIQALVLGGARSGKSALAEDLAFNLGGDSVLYVATADLTADDADLARRVEAHRQRRPISWKTFEVANGGLQGVAEEAGGFAGVLLDSLTLWVAARMAAGDALDELVEFLEAAQDLKTRFVVVSDEVGMGVVPETPAGREFRDLLGLANARVAASAREVHLCVAGVGLRIK
jgi:adenosylcobinamide kinase / adenosylcobinamide-phosphate guanylyltransferase